MLRRPQSASQATQLRDDDNDDGDDDNEDGDDDNDDNHKNVFGNDQ